LTAGLGALLNLQVNVTAVGMEDDMSEEQHGKPRVRVAVAGGGQA
jgi:hypothetical protein